MKIQIDGTNTVNKGAELMLYAILQEIEVKLPIAEVWFNALQGEPNEIQSKIKLKKRKLLTLSFKFPVIAKILKRLHLPYAMLTAKYPCRGIDVVLDAGGFQFSDQWKITQSVLNAWQNYYLKLKEYGTKIILMPQAFGPFETETGKRLVEMLNQHIDLILARDSTSYNYLIKSGINKQKVVLFPDFTASIIGTFPEKYKKFKGGVGIIPNIRMIDKNAVGNDDYFNFLANVVSTIKLNGKLPFLLNHEGIEDFRMCVKINEKINENLEIISDLTALEIKGLISESYLLISSRFHGVASALSTGVPCLSTSWSHKYEMLFNDYDQFNCILNINKFSLNPQILNDFLSESKNKEVRITLKNAKEKNIAKNKDMWNFVWNLLNLTN